MKVLLPEYDYKFEDGSAEIKDGILYIYRPGAFKDVMYKLTYLIFGREECFFCHKKFVELGTDRLPDETYVTQATLDHLIPQEFGGPTITNNMRPACGRCNSTKGNLYPDEFLEYMELTKLEGKEGKKAKHLFKERIGEIQKKRREGEIESIPTDWFTSQQIKNVYVSIWINEQLGAKYYKREKFFKKNNRLPDAVIISNNQFVLDGFNTILVAKNNHISNVKIICLENVEYFGFPIEEKENVE